MTKEEKEKIFGKDYHEINDKKIVSRMIMSDTFPEQWTFFKEKCSKNELYEDEDYYNFSFVLNKILVQVNFDNEKKCLNIVSSINGLFNINELGKYQDKVKEIENYLNCELVFPINTEIVFFKKTFGLNVVYDYKSFLDACEKFTNQILKIKENFHISTTN